MSQTRTWGLQGSGWGIARCSGRLPRIGTPKSVKERKDISANLLTPDVCSGLPPGTAPEDRVGDPAGDLPPSAARLARYCSQPQGMWLCSQPEGHLSQTLRMSQIRTRVPYIVPLSLGPSNLPQSFLQPPLAGGDWWQLVGVPLFGEPGRDPAFLNLTLSLAVTLREFREISPQRTWGLTNGLGHL